MTIADNVNHIRQVIHSHQSSAQAAPEVTLICVSKYHTIEEARAVYQAGVRDFAENYVAGLKEKKEALPDDITWHLIGPLQSRKVKEALPLMDVFHALDRVKIAAEIQKRSDHILPCYLEVNLSGEETKHGIAKDQVFDFLEAIKPYDKVQIIGLMTMAKTGASPDEVRETFRQLRQLGLAVQALHLPQAPCQGLSMGMSIDYPLAVEEGATAVRVGSAFFQ